MLSDRLRDDVLAALADAESSWEPNPDDVARGLLAPFIWPWLVAAVVTLGVLRALRNARLL